MSIKHKLTMLAIMPCMIVGAWATPAVQGGNDESDAWAHSLGKGGAQIYAERLRNHRLQHGEPPHPLHRDRPTVRKGSGKANFTIEASGEEPFSHFFETSVGSGHMALTLRQDWREHVAMAARDLGVKHIRGHGLLDDDMSVSYDYQKHAFYNVDSLVDFLDSVGMRPIFELSFMPSWLTSGPGDALCAMRGGPVVTSAFVTECQNPHAHTLNILLVDVCFSHTTAETLIYKGACHGFASRLLPLPGYSIQFM
eukprot:m.102305 g.102305  ORF g.102305 m.102305 type:complete len:253 (-) comp16818_c2_seq9:61-819(-)